MDDKFLLVIPQGYEIIRDENGNYYAEKKKTEQIAQVNVWPQTYEECCEVLEIKGFHEFELVPTKLSYHGDPYLVFPSTPYYKEINAFYKLLICRDAYWKLIGNRNPVHESGKHVEYFTISMSDENIYLSGTSHSHRVLEFPTQEIRDIFYRNFIELIDNCKCFL